MCNSAYRERHPCQRGVGVALDAFSNGYVSPAYLA
jgi:hypothetical protein